MARSGRVRHGHMACNRPVSLPRIDPVDQTEPPIDQLAQPAEALRPDLLAQAALQHFVEKAGQRRSQLGSRLNRAGQLRCS